MSELFKELTLLSIEELECVITKAQELIQEKEREAELEKQRLEQERKEAERKAEIERQRLEQERRKAEQEKQEEIARLQQRLKELQGDIKDDAWVDMQESAQVNEQTPIQQNEQDNVQSTISREQQETFADVESKEPEYSMISCPECHKLVPSNSRFCYYCGNDITQKKESKEDKSSSVKQDKTVIICPNCHARVPRDSKFCQECGKQIESIGENTESQQNEIKQSSVYMGDAVKKWEMIPGEGEVLGWKEVNISEPEKKQFADMKITTKRILISVESRMQRGMRNGGGLLVYAATAGMEKGKPWVMIPLECIRAYKYRDKKEIQIEADKTYIFSSSKAKDIYAALQQLLPQKAV